MFDDISSIKQTIIEYIELIVLNFIEYINNHDKSISSKNLHSLWINFKQSSQSSTTCYFVFSSGRHSGKKCGKTAVNGTSLCSLHSELPSTVDDNSDNIVIDFDDYGGVITDDDEILIEDGNDSDAEDVIF
jgi:hypothetical protein